MSDISARANVFRAGRFFALCGPDAERRGIASEQTSKNLLQQPLPRPFSCLSAQAGQIVFELLHFAQMLARMKILHL